MIQITGATGNLGTATIHFLLKKGFPASEISALVRDEAKAVDLAALGISIRKGDYTDYPSLVEAFTGVDKLLLISSSVIPGRSEQHRNAVLAAKAAGVKHIIYTSFQRKNENSSPLQAIAQSHLDTEKEIFASGLTYTILQNGLYADILPWFMGEKLFETGIFLPAGHTKAAFTVREDLAEAAANVLSEKGHENKVYLTANNELNSFDDIAGIMTGLSGREVQYVDAPHEVFIETLTKAGVPAEFIGMFAGFSKAIKQGEFDFANNDLEKLLKRKATSIKHFLRKVYFPS